jgi:hypothetical protein
MALLAGLRKKIHKRKAEIFRYDEDRKRLRVFVKNWWEDDLKQKVVENDFQGIKQEIELWVQDVESGNLSSKYAKFDTGFDKTDWLIGRTSPAPLSAEIEVVEEILFFRLLEYTEGVIQDADKKIDHIVNGGEYWYDKSPTIADLPEVVSELENDEERAEFAIELGKTLDIDQDFLDKAEMLRELLMERLEKLQDVLSLWKEGNKDKAKKELANFDKRIRSEEESLD